MGPIGHVYFAQPPGSRATARYAEALVREARIPLVFYRDGGAVKAVNPRGRFDLESESEEILGPAHPFAGRVAEDLAGTCRHPNAGDLVISGWRPDAPPLTFAMENGAHGGPGREETRGFILIPKERRSPPAAYRPTDLRAWVFRAFSAR